MAQESPASSSLPLISKSLGTKTYSLRPSPTQSNTLASWFKSVVGTLISLPVMLPWGLIMMSPWRTKFLSWMIPKIMSNIGKEFRAERETLLEGVSGRVLDVGSGAGAYLAYCSDADEVVAVEPLAELHGTIREKGKDLKSLVIYSTLDDVSPTDRFDWVILGNVLCEVPDVKETLERIDGMLVNPGGRVYFMEHIGRPVGTWKRKVQDVMNPVWKHCGPGCNCNRDSLRKIISMPSWTVIHWEYTHVQAAFGTFVVGLAIKG